jgi:hypothetical protein
MKSKFKQKSPVDSIIIDLILDHYNIQSLSGRRESLTGTDFTEICKEAEQIYFKTILISKEPGVA